MLEINGNHTAELSDENLCGLVGMLCEPEMRRRRLHVSAVTWGSDQNAKDAGLDVRVASGLDGCRRFHSKPSTGFQVKKSDMPRAAIIDEIKPEGMIRPSITALAQESGAYIIVSADGSATDSALKSRRDVISEAMLGVPHGDECADPA
ncbi:hypothetical protein ACF1BQ_020475 [Bradyrhizobium sp. RDT10]